ncbi:MAG TPA: cell division protein SepF [Solirubrobacteraceae bacterium]|nr:cell division protein SepF [Solirubrobacteraceae bacterium]
MPGTMHRMGVYLGLVEDDDFGDGGDGYGQTAERAPVRRDDYAEGRYPRDVTYSRGEAAREHDGPDAGYAEDHYPAYQITTLHPRTYNEARTIGEHFRRSTPVIMNLSEMDDADAKRLVDFAAGLTFGLHGRIERVTAKVFLLSPDNVQVTAADKARIAENGFFNQS